jgi:hypothetical protein
MRSISAAIIVLSGAVMLGFAGTINSDAQTFIGGVGICLGMIGLIAWFVLVTNKES